MSALAKINASSPSALTVIEPASFSLAPVRSDEAEQRFHASIRQVPDAFALIMRDRRYAGPGWAEARQMLIAIAIGGAAWAGVFGLTRMAF